jgi:serine-type D-Ala-D-Ala carboxypeptidase/endopeptidase (penicillin-binding protein 4)
MLDKSVVVVIVIGLALSSCATVPPERGTPGRGQPERIPPERVPHERTTPERVVFARVPPAEAVRNTALDTLREQIDSLLNDSAFAPSLIGIKVVLLDSGRTVYERNSNKLFHPASNMKLLTTAAALKLLSPEFRFRTSVRADSAISHGVLHGNLYVKGSGDPLVRTSDIDSLASKVRSSGITRISGDIVGDVTYFDTLSWGAGWMWDDEPSSDEAFITPLTVNDNAIDIVVRPGRRRGERPLVLLEPPTRYVSVLNSATTSFDTLIPSLTVTRPRGGNTLRLDGRIPPHSPEQRFKLSVWRPEYYFLQLFREKLIEQGVKVGKFLRLDSARGTVQLAEVSHEFDSVLHQINKASDNLGAENLLKVIGAEKNGPPGSAVQALLLVKSSLASAGVDTANLVLSDGSGVSWYNEVSPGALVQLLTGMYRDHTGFARFYESLPVGGVDGTLKNRLWRTRAEGNVHAKTGSLSGVSSLSGYVTSADGKLLAFSILCNHFPAQLSLLRDLQDRIVSLLAGSHSGRE